ncbi:MAG: hypothetical protein CBC29_06460 [Methylococcaceae bacterium TMED69]|nr:MAG: hypothetical protein CBC29_06460 [Methylococcaceae bacterium TMED69]|tara:strand:- start:4993 stop:5595 length:603 start_codon:yes stop_codon:yes gene_type:complete
MKITRSQIRSIIREAIDKGPDFPDLSHPTIAKFADKTYGPTEPMGRTKWFSSMQSYKYRAGGSSDQTITVYHLPDGQYMARIGGSYSNTLSNDRTAGKHLDAISAIEGALDSSPSSTGPTARQLLTPVGERSKPSIVENKIVSERISPALFEIEHVLRRNIVEFADTYMMNMGMDPSDKSDATRVRRKIDDIISSVLGER